MKMTRSNFLKAILAAFAAPLAWLVPRPEVVELKPVDLEQMKVGHPFGDRWPESSSTTVLHDQWQYPEVTNNLVYRIRSVSSGHYHGNRWRE